MKKVLITGGAGYIGCIMTELFLSKGYKVLCIDRFYFGIESINRFMENENYSYSKKDIRNVIPEDLVGIDFVVDLAGISNDPACDLDPKITDSINHLGALNIAKCAKEAGVRRYIMASSCSIYGASDGTPLNENSEKKPVSLYAKSKIDSENEIIGLSSDKFSITFLRLSTVFGGSYRMRFDLIINIMTMYAVTKNKVMVLGGGKQWRPLVHVKDVARAFMAVIEAPSKKVNGEAFNVGSNNQNYQVIQVANHVKQVVRETEVLIIPDDPDKRNYNVNFDKIVSTLNFKTKYDINFGIEEVKEGILSGRFDPDDIKTVTVKYYKYLIESDRILNEIKINGQIF